MDTFSGSTFADVIMLALVALMVLIIVRPGSKAATLVEAVANVVLTVVKTATQG